MKNKYFLSIISAVAMSACGGMDDVYDEFIGEAPIVYLQKFVSDSITVRSGRERVQITLPSTKDPRIDFVRATWSNGSFEKKVPVVYGAPTVFIIDENLQEGNYDFVFQNRTEDGLYSIPATLYSETFGAIYESYLLNRSFKNIEVNTQTDDITLNYPNLNDSTIMGVELKWTDAGVNRQAYFPNTEDNIIALEQFPFDSEGIGEFQYRTHVLPVPDAIDTFFCAWKTCRFRVEDEVIPALYDPSQWTVTTSQPTLVDGSSGPWTCLIDGNANTFLSMRKPTKGNDGAGVPVPDGADYFFTVDLKKETKFDYFEWYHRGNDTQLGLRAWTIAVHGSNNGTDFTKIGNDINIPGETDTSIKNATLYIPESSYRYLKVQFLRWSTTANTAVQVGEFKLGYSKTPTGKGVGVVL